MASLVLGAVGSQFGGAVGGYVGRYLGGQLDGAIFGGNKLPNKQGPRMADTALQVSTYGKPVSIAYGRNRLAGNVIWSAGIREVATTSTQSSGGKGGGGVSQSTTNYSYYCSLAIAICEGPIAQIVRVWADAKPLDVELSAGNYAVYLGDEIQLADATMEAHLGVGKVPAYRGMAYVVIKDFPLAAFGNRIPNFTFEIVRPMRAAPALEDKIKSMVLIPASGEFVYETEVTTKLSGTQLPSGGFVNGGVSNLLNMHNFNAQADVLESLDQLKITCPNVEWISLVVMWFATSKHPASLQIVPKVEYDDSAAQVTPSDWSCNGLTRATAQLVQFINPTTPNYGGTPSDKSVIDLLVELKARGYKVLFYPFLAVDTLDAGAEDAKPWRGRITPTSVSDVNAFFVQYNNFVNYYASLSFGGHALRDNVDCFCIGSELVGMTSYSSATGVFPAVTKLKNLAASVKAVMPAVPLTYAADWTEYHSTNGWYNMDALWADSNISYVGIDAYFPLTPDLEQSQINAANITEYWEKGEGWDYYWNPARTVQTNYSGATYAWKNHENWWNSAHVNPDASATSWTAKMKPLWFTEIGFPSVDGCANQPNVFVDPNSIESFYPRGSKQRVDFAAQRVALEASLDYLAARNAVSGNADLVPQAFVWTWDARPFPFWPDLTNVWADAGMWQTGHWVQGKLGISSLGMLVAALLQRVGLTPADYDVSRLSDNVEGFFITRQGTVRQALEELQAAYFFDMVESGGQLKFVRRGMAAIAAIAEEDLIGQNSGGVKKTLQVTRKQELDLPARVNVVYTNRAQDYQQGTQISQRQTGGAVNQVTLNLPLVMSDQVAKNVADIALYTEWLARNEFHFILPPSYVALEPTDVVSVSANGVTHNLRMVDCKLSRFGMLECKAVSEDVAVYDFYSAPSGASSVQNLPAIVPTSKMILLDLPPMPTDNNNLFLRAACAGLASNWQGAVLYRSDDGGVSGGNNWDILGSQSASAVCGTALSALAVGPVGIIDNLSFVDVYLLNGELSSVNMAALLNGANVAMLGDEIIQFQTVSVLWGDAKKLRLSGFIRGRQGTEWAIASHAYGEDFVLLDTNLFRQNYPLNLLGQTRQYKAVSVGSTLGATSEQSFNFSGRGLKPFAPVQLRGVRVSNDWNLSWIRRTRFAGEWMNNVDVPLNEVVEAYEIEVLNGANVVRVLSANTPAVVYSAAQQVVDFGVVQASLSLVVYQLSAVVGRGYGLSGVV